MTLLARLEQKIGWLAIARLPVYIVAAQAILYLYGMMNPGGIQFLLLDPAAVRFNHEYWRLLTFVFVTPAQNAIFAFFYLYLIYAFGIQLEDEWGSFPFTLFYLLGVAGSLAAAFLTGIPVSSFFLNTTIFLAFAALYPDYRVLLFFILPVKIRWLGWLTWAWILYLLWGTSPRFQLMVALCVANYFVFFTSKHAHDARMAMERWRHRRRFKDWNS